MDNPSSYSKKLTEDIEKENAAAAAKITLGPDELEKRFNSHDVGSLDASLIVRTRDAFKSVAWFVDMYIPPGRAKNVALTELENASMWAIKAIAENPHTLNEENPIEQQRQEETAKKLEVPGNERG